MNVAEWKCLCSQMHRTGHVEEGNDVKCWFKSVLNVQQGPGRALHLELSLFVWLGYFPVLEMWLFGLAYKKEIAYFGLIQGIWQIHLGGGKGKRLSLGFLLWELMLWILQGITVMQRVRIHCESAFFVSALTEASWGGLERGWIRSLCNAGLCYIGYFHLQSLFV